MWVQKSLTLTSRPSGYHLVTDEVLRGVPELSDVRVGILQVFIQHTSASLTLNENADPTVRQDFRSFSDRLIPEGQSIFLHTDEGPDDMPAHLKASIIGGSSLMLPVTDGQLAIGIWQGIYLCEHRNHGGARRILLTLNGE